MLLFQDEGAVDGEGEVCDRVEHVQQEDEHHRDVNLARPVKSEPFVRISCEKKYLEVDFI